jgi:hypothetical protein
MYYHVRSVLQLTALSTTEKMVLVALADRANEEGKCWPSMQTLALRTSLGERSIQRSLRRIPAELLAMEKGAGRHRTTLYILRLPLPETVAVSPETPAACHDNPPLSSETPPLSPQSPPQRHPKHQEASFKQLRRDQKVPAQSRGDPLPDPPLPFTLWKAHRREMRKPLGRISTQAQLRLLQRIGELRAIAAIEHSVANGWQGCIEPTPPRRPEPWKPKEDRPPQRPGEIPTIHTRLKDAFRDRSVDP